MDKPDAPPPDGTSTSLDPDDWGEFRRLAHMALDDMITGLERVGAGPVWRGMPETVREQFRSALPRQPSSLAQVLQEFETAIVPYVTGNRHPLFMGWVHGAGTPVGMVAEMLAAGLNANCGGRDHVGIEVERQIASWAAELFGYPRDASGLFVTGTSMANFLAVLVARTAAVGAGPRRAGCAALTHPLVAYTSSEAHGCVPQAMELAGLGSDNLRRIAADRDGRLDVAALRRRIGEDRAAGHQPFLLVASAGTVNTGAFDDLSALAGIARAERLWFHIDGAFGAMFALSPALRPRLAGIEQSHSIAFDFHKWAQVPYDAGFLLVRDPAIHRATFASPAAYLSRAPRGLAAGETWPSDLGPDLSRGFRALKTWFTLRVHGSDRIGATIEQACAAASHLEARVRDHPELELVSPAHSNIVCFSVRGDDRGERNQELVMDLHESGEAVPSITVVAGRPVIRCAIVNHRTTTAHIDRFVDGVVRRLHAGRTSASPLRPAG